MPNLNEQTNYQKGKYIYAITGSNGAERIYDFTGIGDSKVYTISNGHVAAVVSDAPSGSIRPERRNLAAHQGILKQLMQENTVLPVAFGLVADGTPAIQKVLSLNQKVFVEQLNYLKGKVEMGLRVVWDVANIFDYFVHIHPELRAARDSFFGTNREASQEDKLELGRMFDRILKDDRQAHIEKVEGILSPYCADIKKSAPRNEREVMNLACLIKRSNINDFESGVLAAAKLFDDSFAFDYNGPWAPYNFVEINLQM